ncbi:MAG TPA: GDP-L-fucose synthase [Candidatus Angelobacter sp.]|nr:GDP-L-fucose synthase [Candidatus Angelobacter sp.]
MNKQDKIFVAGHRGLVGSAIVRRLQTAGFTNLVTRSRAELDLLDQQAVRQFFSQERPDHVMLAAARVGGILANSIYSAEFIRENLLIQTHVIHEAYRHGVEHLLFLGSSCIYPRDCPQPIREEYFMTGPLEKTNSAYAAAKIAGVEMCHAYNRQYGTRYICTMPTNLYGREDNFDAQTSHVLAAMIRKFHEAKISGQPVVLWGTGTPRREFLHVDDMADACVHIMTVPENHLSWLFSEDFPPLINIGCGQDLSIRELAASVAEVVGYRGRVEWDPSKPDGTPRKLLDISRLRRLTWEPRISLPAGIRHVYDWFQETEVVKQ